MVSTAHLAPMKNLLPRLPLFALVCLGLLSFAGCLSTPKINSINVGIVELKPGANADQISVVLFYSNENVIPIAIAETSHKLYINGKLLGKSEDLNPVGLPPARVTHQTVTLLVKDKALLQSLIASADAQSASYRIESRLTIMSGEEEMLAKPSSNGSVDLRPLAGQ